jgi:hypothetical protein
MAWLGRFSQGFRQAFDAVFSPLWVHLLMHAGLFAVLAVLLTFQLHRFSGPNRRMLVLLVLGVVLGVGLLQEGFQSFSNGVLLPGAAAFDLGVDLAGGLLGFVIAQGSAAYRYKINKQG